MVWAGRLVGALGALLLLSLSPPAAAADSDASVSILLTPGSVGEDIDITLKALITNEDTTSAALIVHVYVRFPWEGDWNYQYANWSKTLAPGKQDNSLTWTTHTPAGLGGKNYVINITMWISDPLPTPPGGWRTPQPNNKDVTIFINPPFTLSSGLGLALVGIIIAVIIIIVLAIVAIKVGKKKRVEALQRKKMEDLRKEQIEKMSYGGTGSEWTTPGPQYGGGPPGPGPMGPMQQPPMGGPPMQQPPMAGPPMGAPPMHYGQPGPPMGQPMRPPMGAPPPAYAGPPMGAPPLAPPAPSSPPPGDITCGSCGTKSDARAPACWKCGASLKK